MSSLFGSQDQSRLKGKMQSSCGALDFNIIPFKQSDDPSNFTISDFDLNVDYLSPNDSSLEIDGHHKLTRTPLLRSVLRFDAPSPGLLRNYSVKLNTVNGNVGGAKGTNTYIQHTVVSLRNDIVAFKLVAQPKAGESFATLFSPYGCSNSTQSNTPIVFKLKLTYFTPSGLAMSAETDIDILWSCTAGVVGTGILAP